MAFWHDSGPLRRSSQVDVWRLSPKNNVLACFRVFRRLSSNEADPSVDMKLVWPVKRELGGRVYANIVDDSW
eukprot:4978378-Pyramimonas_sp.AAC.1